VGRAAAWAQLHVSDLYITLHAPVIGTEAVGMNVEGLFVYCGFFTDVRSSLVNVLISGSARLFTFAADHGENWPRSSVTEGSDDVNVCWDRA
jgi:hypothetical protein